MQSTHVSKGDTVGRVDVERLRLGVRTRTSGGVTDWTAVSDLPTRLRLLSACGTFVATEFR